MPSFRPFLFLIVLVFLAFGLKTCSSCNKEPEQVVFEEIKPEEWGDEDGDEEIEDEEAVGADSIPMESQKKVKPEAALAATEEAVNPSVEKCKETVPASLADFCHMIKSAVALQCVEHLLNAGEGLDSTQFESCSVFKDSAEIECLKVLKPRNARICIGVRNKHHVQCLKEVGGNHKWECLAIDTLAGAECMKILFDKNWNHLFEICPLVSQTSEVQCLRASLSAEGTFPCYPWKRAAALKKCGRPTNIDVERGKITVLKVDKDVEIGSGSLNLFIESGVSAAEPIFLIRANAIRGQFSKVNGLQGFNLLYFDNHVLLTEGNGEVSDRRKGKDKKFDYDEYLKICEPGRFKKNRNQPNKKNKKKGL